MKNTTALFSMGLVVMFALGACGGAAAPAPTAMPAKAMADAAANTAMPKTMTDTHMMTGTGMMDHGMMTDTHMMTGTGMMPDMPKLSALQNLVLTDAQTGKMFKLADYLGKTVYVEPMATWCPNCRAQLAQVTSAKKQVASDNVKFVALSVEVGLDPAKLAQYAKDTGYDLQFAVLNADGLKALNDAFGQSALNPPSTPHFIIKPDGTMSALVTGPEAAAALVMKLK
ncbi:MAG: TlpA disulfide reductase family protein [Anaerolineae bacterium]